MIKNKKLISALVIYCILFYTAWSLVGVILRNYVAVWTDSEIIIQLVGSGIIKNLVWTLPAFLLIKHFETDMYVGLKEMFTTKVKIWDIILVCIACVIYALADVIKKWDWSIAESFGWGKIIIILFVGITEEMVFRGWLLNSTLKNADKEWKKWLAIGINAVMFLLIHFPIWIYEGVFARNIQSFAFVGIILLSGIFSWLFLKTKNILVPVALHMIYDLLVFMFIGG